MQETSKHDQKRAEYSKKADEAYAAGRKDDAAVFREKAACNSQKHTLLVCFRACVCCAFSIREYLL